MRKELTFLAAFVAQAAFTAATDE